MSVFRKVLGLSAIDAAAKGLSFVALVYVARRVGAEHFGVLEFAASLLSYFVLLADGGLELWATRAASTGTDVRDLVAQVLPLRFIFAGVSILVLVSLLPVLPRFEGLGTIVLLFSATLLPQAASLKWLYLGQQNVWRVAVGLLVSQVVFSLLVFTFFRDSSQLLLVPLFRLAADTGMAVFFWRAYIAEQGWPPWRPPSGEARTIMVAALILGLTQAIGLLSYSFNTMLLGYLKGATEVGWFSAAYKPVIAVLALPLAYYASFFPVLARAYIEGSSTFHKILARSLRLTAMLALPLGVSVSFLAEPIIVALFGDDYRAAIPVLQVLCWSAVLVTLRGNFRQSLNAAGMFSMDLRSSSFALGANVAFNLALIPRYGPVGAASATVASDLVWLCAARFYARRHLAAVRSTGWLWRPTLSAMAMAACFALMPGENWLVRLAVGAAAYMLTLAFSGEFRPLLAKAARPLTSFVEAGD